MEVKPMEYRGKPKWITKELEILLKERKLADFKARRSKKMEDEIESRQVRNKAAKAIKNAKTEFLKVKLKNLRSNYSGAWDAVNTYLGWNKPMCLTQLIQNKNVMTEGPELFEGMLKQYERRTWRYKKPFRPAALLSAISRIMEAIMTKQLEKYQEEQELVHKRVHGFRKG